MSSIPVDVLRLILEHVDDKDLLTICLLNKICCSCSQDIIYRDIYFQDTQQNDLCRTLARSTHLAERVRSFHTMRQDSELPKALRNMTFLRDLSLFIGGTVSNILDGCTFKLSTFFCYLCCDESLAKFLNSQPSLRNFGYWAPPGPFEQTCLLNVTWISATYYWLLRLVPGRPVSKVDFIGSSPEPVDLSFCTLSTDQIQNLTIDYSFIYPKPGHHLASIFPALTYLKLGIDKFRILQKVRGPDFIYLLITIIEWMECRFHWNSPNG
jgi:hypothetical protein